MQHFIRRSLYVAVLLVMPVLLPSGSFAWDYDFSDLNLRLKGEYRTSFFESCVQTAEGGFDDDFRVTDFGGFRTRTHGGITTYNGDGTGTSSTLVLNMFSPNVPGAFFAVSRSQVECDLTYTVNPDRSFTQTLTSCRGTILNGPRTGQPFTVSDVELQGQIARWRQILSFTNNDTNVLTLTINPGDGLPDEIMFERICGGIGTGVRRSVYEHDYDDDREYDYHRDSGYDYDDDDEDKHKHKDKHRDKQRDKHRHRDDD